MTIGSDFYLVLDKSARARYYHNAGPQDLNYTQGYFSPQNGSLAGIAVRGVMGIAVAGSNVPAHTFKSEFDLKCLLPL